MIDDRRGFGILVGGIRNGLLFLQYSHSLGGICLLWFEPAGNIIQCGKSLPVDNTNYGVVMWLSTRVYCRHLRIITEFQHAQTATNFTTAHTGVGFQMYTDWSHMVRARRVSWLRIGIFVMTLACVYILSPMRQISTELAFSYEKKNI